MSQSKFVKWFLPIGILISPFVLLNSLIDPDQSIRFLYLTIFGTLITAILIAGNRRQVVQVYPEILHWSNPVFICLVALLLASFLSLIVALQKSEGLVEIARIIFLLISYVWVSVWIRFDSKNTIYLSIGFCLLSLLLSSLGIKDLIAGDNSTAYDYYQMTGNMGNRNLLAIMISLCLPFYFILFQHYKSRYVRVGLAAGLAVAVTVVCLTSSRVGWLGLGTMFSVATTLLIIARIKRLLSISLFLKILIGFSAFIFLVIVSIGLLMKSQNTSNAVALRLKSFYNFNSEKNIHTESINERLQLWSNSLQLIKDNPVLGVGAGNWKFRYPEKNLSGRSAQGDVLFQQPHNDFLWGFSETGIIGGCAFIFLFVFSFVSAIRIFFKKRTEPENDNMKTRIVVSTALLCGISMYAVHSFFDFPKERPLILFAFASLLALASSLNDKKASEAPSSKKSWLFAFFFFALALTSILFWYSRMQGEIFLKKAFAARQAGNYQKVKKYLDEVNPYFFESDLKGTPIAWYYGEAEYRLGNLKESQRYFETSLKLSPAHLYSHYNLGALHYYQGNIPAAIQSWENALAIAPDFSDAAINLSSAYYNKGEFEKAVVVLSKVKIDYSNKSNTGVVVAVLSQYISIVKDSVNHPQILASLAELQSDDASLQNMQIRMKLRNKSPREVLLNEAIARAERKQSITKGEADSLRGSYGLNKK